MELSDVLHANDAAKLTAVVRQSLQRDAIQILDWHASQLGGGAGNPVSAGLYRFAGSGLDRGETIRWSVVLKILQSPDNVGWANMGGGDDQTHWNYWKRELFVYQSDLLKTLPVGLTAPSYFGSVELPGNFIWLWLEDVKDTLGGIWPLERYALTARHLGRLNGFYAAARPIPTEAWLGHLLQQWVPSSLPVVQSLVWDHPRVLARYPKGNSFRRMLLDYERFQAKLNLLPRTLCHGDTYPTNFMSRHLATGQEQTIALDWALMNIGPLGDDLGQLVFGAQTKLKQARPVDVNQALFESYLAGLRESGCQIDPALIRFGFAASAAFRVGLFQIYALNEELQLDQAMAGEVVDRSAPPDCFESVMAGEAYELLKSI